MELRLHDSATGQITPLPQRDPGKFSMYVCGPTVYDLPHIGHGRAMLVYDILRRYLTSLGIEVAHVSNITDIDDKIIARANERGVSAERIVEQYEAEWYAAVDKLGILRPTQDPHATAYVDQMIQLIGELIDKGFAYETNDTVYFSPGRVEGYGLLAHQTLESLQSGARVEADEQKRSPVDFALWKKAKPGEPTWDSPWGAGRPGWHTECVVMSLDLLGDGFDLHAGGQDLMFPHHENERAQAVALGNAFSLHWMHHGFVMSGGEKMSKSLNNFTTLTDLLDRTDPRAYRMLVLRAHYRSPLEVTPDTIGDAESAVGRLDEFARRFGAVAANGDDPDDALISEFRSRMDNDLDTPGALASAYAAVRDANAAADAGDVAGANAKARAVFAMCEVFGLPLALESVVDERSVALVRQRDEARATKDWAAADRLRDELQQLGWTVQDAVSGTQIHK